MSDLPTPPPEDPRGPAPRRPTVTSADEQGLDAAQQSLSDALGVSFTVLKVLMVVLIVVYLFSGVFQVDEQNKAVRLRFGQTVNDANGQPIEYGPGWHLGLPYPLEEVIQVPIIEQRINIDEAFWYDVPEGTTNTAALSRQPLNPLKDGFLITGDANVVHAQFIVGYRVDNLDKYIQNVGDTERAEEIVRMAAERGMVIAMASADAKQVINRQTIAQAGEAQRLANEVLGELNTGLVIQQVQINNPSPPVQIQQSAYQLVSAAEQDRGTAIQNARQQATQTLNDVAGAAHREFSAMVRAYEAAAGANDADLADAMRAEIDRSIRTLQLAGPTLSAAVDAYLGAMTRTPAAGLDEAAFAAREAEIQAERDEAATDLTRALAQVARAPREERIGRPFGGEVAQTINSAQSYQSQAVSRIEQEYQTFVTWRERFATSPELVASEVWQQSRTQALADAVNQTIYVDTRFLRVLTDPDPAVVQEIVEAQLQRQRDQVNQRGQELNQRGR